MHRGNRYVALLSLTSALALPIATAGCAEHSYRVYDPYYHDYHRWGPDEDAYYHRWEAETHREHRDWGQRPADEQKEYWNWRHGQGAHGQDHDHDHH